MGMQFEPFVKVTTIYNAVVVLSLLAYLAIVPNFIVFTNEYLTTADVPYYATNPNWGWFNWLADPFFTDQFGMEWIWLVTDTWRVIFPSMWMFLLAASAVASVEALVLVVGVTFGVLGFIEIIKTVLRSWQYGFCVNFQICRNWDPSKCDQSSCTPNYAFQWIFWYQIVFLIISLLYLVLILFVTGVAKEWKIRVEKWKMQELEKIRKDPSILEREEEEEEEEEE